MTPWEAMLLYLAGEPMPAPPAVPLFAVIRHICEDEPTDDDREPGEPVMTMRRSAGAA